MKARTETQSIESDVDPAAVLAVLADPDRLPEWAPGFADSVAGDAQSGLTRTKGGQTFPMGLAVRPDAGTVDYLREVAPGEQGGAFLRAMPRPGGGSVVTITVPVAPDAEPAEVGAILRAELAAIVSLASSGSQASSAS